MDFFNDPLPALTFIGAEPVLESDSRNDSQVGEYGVISNGGNIQNDHIFLDYPSLDNEPIRPPPHHGLPPNPDMPFEGYDSANPARQDGEISNHDLEMEGYTFAYPTQQSSEILPAVPWSSNSQALDYLERRLEHVNPLGRCAFCRFQRRRCEVLENSNDPRCVRCIAKRFPASICISARASITQHRPFEKWKNTTYENLFTAVQGESSIATTVKLGHYRQGPILTVSCCEFSPIYSYQVRALRKNSLGWHSTPTTAYCLTESKLSISAYVRTCVPYAVNEVCRNKTPVSVFFHIAWFHRKIPVIRDCLELFTCLRLLSIGWKFHGDETLGMGRVEDSQSAWYGEIPVPRMIQNQLGHQLELRMIELDFEILSALHGTIKERDRSFWLVVTLAVFMLLHVRELDGARNIFWKRYKDLGGFWIHPARPASLIEEEIFSCQSLLSFYHCSMSRSPLSMNWDLQKTKNLVNNDDWVIKSMKCLQSYIRLLRERDMIGHKASDVYKEGNPESVRLTISSLMFGSVETGCNIEGFS